MSRRVRRFTDPTKDVAVEFPLHYSARSYQWEFYQAMRQGCKRACLVWHRRAGKDLTVLNWTIESMLTRPGTYNYFFPTYKLGKRIMWDGMQADGRAFMSHLPQDLVVAKNETEMKLTMRIGGGHQPGCPDPLRCPGMHSVFQIVGADEADTTSVGTNPIGCVFSEFAIMDPKAWNLTRPILAENGGWAVFDYTPRGKNHAYTLWKNAVRDAEWFASLRSIDMTMRDAKGEPRHGQRVISMEDIAKERRSGMAEELIQQEFFCSFEGAVMGAYYADQIRDAYNEQRIGKFQWNPDYTVDTAWDLGRDDATAIWFVQRIGGRLYFIDYMESSSHGLGWYIKKLREKPYKYNRHFAPHDAAVHEYSTNKTRVQFAQQMGLTLTVIPKISVEEGINACRVVLPLASFDDTEMDQVIDDEHAGKSVLYTGGSRGVSCLASYTRKFDEENQAWALTPLHNWASNGADAFRSFAVAYHSDIGREDLPWRAKTHYDMHGPLEQSQAIMHAAPSRKYAPEERAVTEVERGEDWWR